MDDITFVGLDVHKATVCVAGAESGRGGEVRQIGVFENRPEILGKMVARLAKSGRRLSFCYEAGPCGYGLHRLLTGSGHECAALCSSRHRRNWGCTLVLVLPGRCWLVSLVADGHGAALPAFGGGTFAQRRQDHAHVRSRRGECVPAPALA